MDASMDGRSDWQTTCTTNIKQQEVKEQGKNETPDNGTSVVDFGVQRPSLPILSIPVDSSIFYWQCADISIQYSAYCACLSQKMKWHFPYRFQEWTAEKAKVTLTIHYHTTISSLYNKEEVLCLLRKHIAIVGDSKDVGSITTQFMEKQKMPISLLRWIFRHFFLAYRVQ